MSSVPKKADKRNLSLSPLVQWVNKSLTAEQYLYFFADVILTMTFSQENYVGVSS